MHDASCARARERGCPVADICLIIDTPPHVATTTTHQQRRRTMPHAYKTRNACKRGIARAGAVIQEDIPETVNVEKSIEQVVGGYAGTFTFSEPVELSGPMIAKRFRIVVVQPDADAADTTTKAEAGEQEASRRGRRNRASPRVTRLARVRAQPPLRHRHSMANRRSRSPTQTRHPSSTLRRSRPGGTSRPGPSARSWSTCYGAKADARGRISSLYSSRRTASSGHGRRSAHSCVTTSQGIRLSAFARSSARTAITGTSPHAQMTMR